MVVEYHPTNKALGQHWLHDTATLSAIVAAANIDAASTVLEIGPGLGTLTKVLLATNATVVAVEYDTQLAQQLDKSIPSSRLTVVNHDILTYNFTRLPKDYTIVANIPYYITSKLVRLLCESSNPPRRAVLLVQKEVAQRIAAVPGGMSLLSVSAQVYNSVSLGTIVPAALFTPPPKVDSQVVILERRSQPLVPAANLPQFFQMVKAGFSERRKKLRSSLSGGLRIEKSQADTLLAAAKISPSARAQELYIADWQQLTEIYNKDLASTL